MVLGSLSTLNKQHLQRALTLLCRFQEHKDETRVNKIVKLIKKIYENDFMLAFSGHFSAGKSSMINALIGEQILPSSPIPTSANLVKIRYSKNDYAKVIPKQDKAILFQAPYQFSTIKEFCKYEDIDEIEIARSDITIPADVTIMDTPGIDSTDDAHQLSTESALHLADLVFYVMDYNHVQSELNFYYISELINNGVNVYVIINQIDKHNDLELTFQEFKQSVTASFATWDVEPARIFYTSLKECNLAENQFETVKSFIHNIIHQRQQWIDSSIEAAIKQLKREHELWLRDQKSSEQAALKTALAQYDEVEISNALTNEQLIITRIREWEDYISNWEKEFEIELDKLVQNAHLMPYETRELAKSLIQANQRDFKLGLFFSKKKTTKEREQRLTLFANSVRKQVESQIIWHMREFAQTALNKHEISDHHLQIEAQQLSITFEDTLLTELIKKGAGVTGEYVLNYCNELSEKLRKLAKTEMERFKTSVISILQTKVTDELNVLNKKLRRTKAMMKITDSLKLIDRDYASKQEALSLPTGNEQQTLHQLIQKWEKLDKDVQLFDQFSQPQQEPQKEELQQDQNFSRTRKADSEIDIDHVVERLQTVVTHLKHEPSFERMLSQLEARVEKLQNQQYTVALFGAFSAGKSSFANALIGEPLLPVSPNPTTATINRICPPTNHHPHGKVLVYFKDEETMLADINRLVSVNRKFHSLAMAYDEISTLLVDKDNELKDNQSFLQAFLSGYKLNKLNIGETIVTSVENFHAYVRDERHSCFVHSIDLYYDCSLTQIGITLVDTPGANSINSRHTDVAFNYIKDADAIFFVTYYNHAFSRADREFLIQLGRVKDAFELDKMFFIVNAIDLASSNEEINEVISYVQDELLKNQIRSPKIYGISSQLALNDMTKEQSNIESFNQDFHYFLKHDLGKLTSQAAILDYNRVLATIDQLIAVANEDEKTRRKRKDELENIKTNVCTLIRARKSDVLASILDQEVKELIYYIKQRVFLRFPDFFKEAFNPAVLTRYDRTRLQKCLDELLQVICFDFEQELRATSLRIELFMKNKLTDYIKTMEKDIQNISAQLTIPQLEEWKVEIPTFSFVISTKDRKSLENQLKLFKNAKLFFEKNEKKKMEDSLQHILSAIAEDYLQIEQERILNYYLKLLHDQFEQSIIFITSDIDSQFQVWIDGISNEGKLQEWVEIRSKFTELSAGM